MQRAYVLRVLDVNFPIVCVDLHAFAGLVMRE